MRNWLLFFVGAALILFGALSAAHLLTNEYLFFASYVVLQFVVLATGWNVMGGYAGYVNFGSGAFFAVGAYTAAALFKAYDLPLALQILAAMTVAGALGFAVGVMTLRLRGVFFSIATVAIAVVIETIVLNWSYVGAARGMTALQPAAPLGFISYMRWLFFVMTVLAVLAVAAARYIEISWIGRGLRALRDDEVAAESSGVPTLKMKLLAATISGALMGMAGAPYALYLGFIEPTSVFSLNYAVSALAMPVIGGTSSWLGPVIGAILLATTQQVISVTVSSELNVLIVGALLILFVVAAPQGLLGLARTMLRRKAAR
jgi:branched-chain amino acid transport system permease protein